MIRISVIIPVYNVEGYLKTCLDSVLMQKLHGVEIICIDDGSTDSSLMILKKYEAKKKNIRVLTQYNQGAGPARNLGMKYASGQYICFMDPDDYYPDDTVLEKLYVAAERENVMICGGNILTDSDKGIRRLRTSRFNQNKKIKYEDFLGIYYYWRFIYKKELIKDNAITFPAYRRFQDPPFLVKAMICAKEFYAIEDDVYVYRVKQRLAGDTLEVVINRLQGIRDICQYAKDASLNVLCDKMLTYLMNDIFVIRYAYQGDEKVWRLIDEIDVICGLKKIIPNSIERYVSLCKKEIELLFEYCHLYEKVIIYGAGVVGTYAMKCLSDNKLDILGFAVTEEKDNVKEISGYEVKTIEKYDFYKEKVLILIAVGSKYQDEIRTILDRMGFIHIALFDHKKMRLLEMIEKR